MRKAIIFAALVVAAPGPVLAQPAPAASQRFVPAPWWMDQPVLPSMGSVRTEMLANRASFTGSFKVLDPDSQQATRKAADKVRAMVHDLSAFGAERVRVTTTVFTDPIYDQYRDKDGKLITNQRADKIDTYEATASVAVEVRDLDDLEKAYAMVLAAGPTSTGNVRFSLEPTNDQKTRLYADAVADAVRRAKLAADSTGVRLGAVKVIDPTGRACQTDMLVTGGSRYGGNSFATDVPPPPAPLARIAAAPVTVTASRRSDAETMQLVLQPPMETLEDSACVVYALVN